MPVANDVVVDVPPGLARQFNSVRVRNAVIIDTFLKMNNVTPSQVDRVRGQVRAMLEELLSIDEQLHALDQELVVKQMNGVRWKGAA